MKNFVKSLDTLSKGYLRNGVWQVFESISWMVYYIWSNQKQYGDLLQNENMIERALKAYDKHLERFPNDIECLLQKGCALESINRNLEALQLYTQVSILNQKHPWVHNHRGCCLLSMNRTEEAIEAFIIAIQNDSKFSIAYNNLANSYISLNQYEKALDAIEKSLILNPNCSHSLYIKGFILQEMEKFQDAKIAYYQAVYLDSDYLEIVEEQMKSIKYKQSISNIQISQNIQSSQNLYNNQNHENNCLNNDLEMKYFKEPTNLAEP